MRYSLWFVCALTMYSAPRFETAQICSLCHSMLPAPGASGTNIAPHPLWQSSMKANAARDPYWRARVREETAVNPAAASIIENKCLSCHAPAQQYAFRGSSRPMRFSELNENGEDGVTCTVCHQITASGLGSSASFTAGFEIGAEENIFGPHKDPFTMPMLHHTGYLPTQAKHVLDSALCGTCHTVITPTLDDSGNIRGEFVEQAPFLEWLASAFAREGRTCQSCHTPDAGAASYIAHRPPGGPFPPTSPRTPFGRHFFTGGNVQGLAMLGEAMPGRVTAFGEASARARTMLSQALRLEAQAAWREGILEVSVDVVNLTGHKLPTAYPSRRLWLHVKATDGAGRVMFESGAWDPATGELRDASASQPHRTRISSPAQVMIYEAEQADLAGRHTTSLLRSATRSKDNRILPRGYDPKTKLPDGISEAAIGSVGTQLDSDFRPGADRVIYEIPGKRGRPDRVVAEALYQSIKPAHAQITVVHDTAEARRFAALYTRHRDPVTAASVDVPIPR